MQRRIVKAQEGIVESCWRLIVLRSLLGSYEEFYDIDRRSIKLLRG